MEILLDYIPCRECRNPDSYGMICVKCGECGRKYDDGILVNPSDYPGYDPDSEEEE